MGVTTEGWVPHHRRTTYGEIQDHIPNGYVNAPIGFPSDDSQLAFWTLEQVLTEWADDTSMALPLADSMAQVGCPAPAPSGSEFQAP